MKDNEVFPGYRPFRTKEKGTFFGRENETDELLRRTLEEPFLAVVGPPEIGKSSLVYAGLIPALLKNDWRCAVLRPGENPTAHLSSALEEAHTQNTSREPTPRSCWGWARFPSPVTNGEDCS